MIVPAPYYQDSNSNSHSAIIIYVKDTSRDEKDRIAFKVNEKTIIVEIRKALSEKKNINIHSFDLIFNNKKVSDNQTIQELGIEDNDEIYLLMHE